MDREAPSDGGKLELLQAVIDCVGDLGYNEATVADVTARAGAEGHTFDRYFKDLADCFASAYEAAADDLSETLLAAGREGSDWSSGYRRALDRFLDLVEDQPGLIRVLLVEYRVAGGRPVAKHAKTIEVLGRALDRGRRELRNPDLLPPLTPRLLLGAIEFAVADLVTNSSSDSPSDLRQSLFYLGVLLYRGREAANEQLEG